MKNSYQQLTTNLEYLKLKQLAQLLGDVVYFSINNVFSFVET
ncbi:transposase, partial [Bacillus paranthracis]|nr:transposase [Bacillus paranthracis]